MGVAACAFDRPAGKVSEVFSTEKEREGAYDLLENEHFSHEALVESMACSTAARCRRLPFVYVPIDGMGLSLVDHRGKKDFGAIGSPRAGRRRRRGRGIKVIDALAIDPKGTPIGWLAQRYWARTVEPGARPPKRSFARAALPVEQKETWHWIQVIRAASSKLDAEGVRGWFQLDREGDAHAVLLELARNSHWWTVRNRSNRTIQLNQERAVSRLRDQLMRQRPQGSYALEVSGKWKRRARQANMVVRVGRVTLLLRNQGKPHIITPLPVTAVWTREKGTTPAGEKPIDWMLLTNREVTSLEHAREVIAGYAARWRVEECHKTWKSDACNIENTQLRSASAVMKWATILAAVAARIERLKRLARTEPEAPSTVELTPICGAKRIAEGRALGCWRCQAPRMVRRACHAPQDAAQRLGMHANAADASKTISWFRARPKVWGIRPWYALFLRQCRDSKAYRDVDGSNFEVNRWRKRRSEASG